MNDFIIIYNLKNIIIEKAGNKLISKKKKSSFEHWSQSTQITSALLTVTTHGQVSEVWFHSQFFRTGTASGCFSLHVFCPQLLCQLLQDFPPISFPVIDWHRPPTTERKVDVAPTEKSLGTPDVWYVLQYMIYIWICFICFAVYVLPSIRFISFTCMPVKSIR